ncbi:MAG TPA: class I SAM-dependent methyltransferase [Steroidobacteraceae bacterium]|nr:class I SAM-dependent methyltransferase [Steroidobacteraceae bacterium]
MKPRAILSLLWSSQFEAMRQFLLMHEPLVVIAPTGSMNPNMQASVTDTGGTIVWLDSVLEESLAKGVPGEAALLENQFDDFLQSQRPNEGYHEKGSPASLSSIIRERLKLDLPPTLRLLQSLKSASEKFEIALLATSEDMTWHGKVATAWAKSQGIPSLHFSHAIALVDPYTVHNQLIADKLAVFGKRASEGYLDLGISESRIVVTGNPAWDSYTELRGKKADCRKQLDAKYGLIPELPLVVFGTTWAANLSAYGNERIYAETISAVFKARKALGDRGIEFNTVIKDRAANKSFGERACNDLRIALGVGSANYFYVVDDTQFFGAAADVLIAVDSNYLVEGMLANTPTINLMNPAGELMGPCFEAETGVLEVEFDELADAIYLLLTDHTTRRERLDSARKRAAHYNFGDGDGMAAHRVAQAMAGMTTQLPRRMQRFVWQQYLDVESADVAEAYHTAGRADLAAMFTNTPALVLDVGCAAGSTAALIRQRFPGSRAWGIEMNRAAANMARQKLDKVLVGKFEDFDLEREGIEKGTLDAVLLADVLEHMYNPWDVLVKLRPLMSPTGQLVLSIPNVRNLLLMDELSKGNWTYAGAGLLDITHIRFFTLREILKLCRETGFRVISTQNAIDVRLDAFFKQHQALPLSDINTDRLTFKGVTRDELVELCTLQFYLLLKRDSATA